MYVCIYIYRYIYVGIHIITYTIDQQVRVDCVTFKQIPSPNNKITIDITDFSGSGEEPPTGYPSVIKHGWLGNPLWFPIFFGGFDGKIIPIGSMYGIYANIGGILMVNVTIYSIHRFSGI